MNLWALGLKLALLRPVSLQGNEQADSPANGVQIGDTTTAGVRFAEPVRIDSIEWMDLHEKDRY